MQTLNATLHYCWPLLLERIGGTIVSTTIVIWDLYWIKTNHILFFWTTIRHVSRDQPCICIKLTSILFCALNWGALVAVHSLRNKAFSAWSRYLRSTDFTPAEFPRRPPHLAQVSRTFVVTTRVGKSVHHSPSHSHSSCSARPSPSSQSGHGSRGRRRRDEPRRSRWRFLTASMT